MEQQNQQTTLELIVQELQNRIGQVTTNYEMQMAILKAQVTQELQNKDRQIQSLQEALNAKTQEPASE
jgi:hypothetical protein